MANQRVVIVGGGVMGAATALFLARDHSAQVTVLERDLAGQQASSGLSASSLRLQFSSLINIELSRWSLGFIRRAAEELVTPAQAVNLGWHEGGYLYLAQGPQATAAMRLNHALQHAAHAPVALLRPADLVERFPWLSTQGVELASLGLADEGWFDGPALWQAFKRKAAACGVRFLSCEACGFETRAERVQAVQGPGQARFELDALVLCAGAWSAPLGQRLGVNLPVTARRRDVFYFESSAVTPNCPLVIDPSGLWFRPEGRGFIAGAPPRGADTPDSPLHALDMAQFEEQLWPLLANRVPGFEAARLRSAWAGYYEMNDFDHNGLAGALPGWGNAFTACGFSGHGMQQAPAVGCALAALVAQGECTAPSLAPLSPARVVSGQRLIERNII
jgi:FAD-dependent oxidoreductase domain-containing protein 1